jgi:hypothetical protein
MARTRKTGGTFWRWLDDLNAQLDADLSPRRPERATIIAVAAIRWAHANPDGSSSFPSRSRVATRAGVRRDTVAAVDRWLVDNGLMAKVRTRKGNVTEYRMTHSQALRGNGRRADASSRPHGINQPAEVVPQVVPPVVLAQDHDLLPTKSEEEEEGPSGAADAAAPTAAQIEAGHRVVARLVDANPVPINVDPDVLALGAGKALAAHPAWGGVGEDVLAYLAGAALARAKSNPTAYVSRALDDIARRERHALPADLRHRIKLEALYAELAPREPRLACWSWNLLRSGLARGELDLFPEVDLRDTPPPVADASALIARVSSTATAEALELLRGEWDRLERDAVDPPPGAAHPQVAAAEGHEGTTSVGTPLADVHLNTWEPDPADLYAAEAEAAAVADLDHAP